MHTSPPSFFCNPRMAILLCRPGELRRHNQRATRHRDIIAFCRTTLCTFQAKNSVTHKSCALQCAPGRLHQGSAQVLCRNRPSAMNAAAATGRCALQPACSPASAAESPPHACATSHLSAAPHTCYHRRHAVPSRFLLTSQPSDRGIE